MKRGATKHIVCAASLLLSIAAGSASGGVIIRSSSVYGGFFRGDPNTTAAEAGALLHINEWIALQISDGGGVVGDSNNNFHTLGVGVQASIPFVVSPFIGTGVRFGYADYQDSLFHDGVDDIDNHTRFFGALTLEFGVHLWLSTSVRVSAIGRSYIATTTHEDHYEMFGVGFVWRLD